MESKNGKNGKNALMTIQGAIKEGTQLAEFTCSCTGTVPCTILKLCAGPSDLFNEEFLITNANLVVKFLLITLVGVFHLVVDIKTLLENRLDFLGGPDCADVWIRSRHSKRDRIRRLMIARLSHVIGKAVAEKV